jgi:hypothetical protein
MNELLSSLGWIISAPLLLVIAILVYFLKNFDKLQLASASLMRFFGNFSKSFSKKSIESELSGRILGTVKKLNLELDEILPYEIKVEWKERSDRQSFLDGKRVVLCIDQNKTRTQNVIHAITDYVDNGLYPKFLERLLEKNSVRAQKLVLSRKMIRTVYKRGLRYFNDMMLYSIDSNLENNVYSNYIKMFEALDNNGMFSHIFLREMVKFSNSCDSLDFSELENQNISSAMDGLASFLLSIAEKKKDDESLPLGYTKGPFSISIGLVAKYETFHTYGYEKYIVRFQQQIKKQYKSIYLCSYGDRNVEITMSLQKKLHERIPLLESSKPYTYLRKTKRGEEIRAVTIAFDASSVVLNMQRSEEKIPV